MNFVKRRRTSSKVDIPEGPREEIEYLFLHDIISKVEEYNIPTSLIVNIDQTPIKYVPVGSESLAEKGVKNVTIEECLQTNHYRYFWDFKKWSLFMIVSELQNINETILFYNTV